MIVGLTGKNCAGKGEISEILQKKGFECSSLSDAIRDEADKRRIPKTRENLIRLGNELRRLHGPGILAKRILREIEGDAVVDSIRNVEEIKELRKNKDFVLVGVDAPVELRFKRGNKRDRESEATTLEEFKRREKLENTANKNKQQLDACLSMANVIIINNQTKKELLEKVDKLLSDLNINADNKHANVEMHNEVADKRIGWQDYFMNITREISRRSTCMSTRLGAIIVQDERIVSTGYNGAPRKTLDCNERGFCLRRDLKIPSGHRYELCRSVHAEQNAIINAARAGVPPKGGNMYIYGMKIYEGEDSLIDAFHCFICKKMIINAGIENVYSMTKEGKIKKFNVYEDWVEDWKKEDMLNDIQIYDSDYYKDSKKDQ